MNDPKLHPHSTTDDLGPHRPDRRPLIVAAGAALLVCGVIALFSRHDDPSVSAATNDTIETIETSVPPVAATVPSTMQPPVTSAVGTATTDVPDLAGGDPSDGESCIIKERSLRYGDTGDNVTCLQQALIAGDFLSGAATGSFDAATVDAVKRLQTDRDLFVDGIVGRESAISLGIWPDEQLLVVRTPKPAPGATDLIGMPMSTVSSAGDDAPPLPPNSGSGRRLVYDRSGQRLWAVGNDGRIVRSWLVSGSKYDNETPGTHEVYSRSEVSTAWNGKAYLPKMVRWLKTDIGAIGMHSIPLHREDRSPYQTEAELGQRLSGGCQRQAPADADFVWEWAQIGTKVVVI